VVVVHPGHCWRRNGAEFDLPALAINFILFWCFVLRYGECTTETQETIDEATGGGFEEGKEGDKEDAQYVDVLSLSLSLLTNLLL
jgi:hypothetical protein